MSEQNHSNPKTKFDFDENTLNTPKLVSRYSDYVIDPALHRAVEVAIMLKQPLLLTGEPGTGKTRLAEKLASDLSAAHPDEYLSKPLVFHTKTISSYSDLFYSYDALSHFRDTHIATENSKPGDEKIEKAPEAKNYIYLQALGQAIVLSNKNTAHGNFAYKIMPELGEGKMSGPKSSVVLIDEVDKAPRDFTNDLLNELDRYEFFVKEDHNEKLEKGHNNIFIILTSNSEKNLPEAFLRRCVFYHIDFPDINLLQSIVMSQLFNKESMDNKEHATLEEKVMEYVKYFQVKVRDRSEDKKPATAELISWVQYLRAHVLSGISPDNLPHEQLQASFSILAKDKGDLMRLNESVKPHK